MTSPEIFESARRLGAGELLVLIDSLIDVLDQPDPAANGAWVAEAHERMKASQPAVLTAA